MFNFRCWFLTQNYYKCFALEDKCFQFILDFLLNCGEELKTRALMKNTVLKARPGLTGYFLGGRFFSVMWISAAFMSITRVNHFRSVSPRLQSRGRGKGCILLWAIVAWWLCRAGLAGGGEISVGNYIKTKLFQLHITEWIVAVKFPAVLWELNTQPCCSASCCHKTRGTAQFIGRSKKKETPIPKSSLPSWRRLPHPQSAVLFGWAPKWTTGALIESIQQMLGTSHTHAPLKRRI